DLRLSVSHGLTTASLHRQRHNHSRSAVPRMSPVVGTRPHPNRAKRLECVELAPALERPLPYDSASKLDALQTLRVAVHPQEPLQLASNSDYCTKDKTRPHISAFCFPSFCSFPRCAIASWRLCVDCRFSAPDSPTGRLCHFNRRLATRRKNESTTGIPANIVAP